MKLIRPMAGAAIFSAVATMALADYPERTINMIVPFVAGGGTDVPARFFGSEMEKILGQNIVVSNLDGAGGTIGANRVANADPGGYELLFAPVGTMTTQPYLRNTDYNAESWSPICMVSQGAYYLVVGQDSDLRTFDDYLALAKDGQARFVGAGPGSMDHVAQLTLDKAMGAQTQYLPSAGGPDKATEINGGRADASVWFADYDTHFNFRALAIMADKRSEEHPEIPAMTELGYDVNVSIWFGLFAQDDTPADVVAKLSSACGEAVASEKFQADMTGANRKIEYMDSETFTAFFHEAYELNGELMKEAGLSD